MARVSHQNVFKKKMAQPAPQVFGGYFEKSKRIFDLDKFLGVHKPVENGGSVNSDIRVPAPIMVMY